MRDSEGRELKKMGLGHFAYRVVVRDPGKAKPKKATSRKVKR